MFDEHLNRQHRLSYLVRGPEWAFAIPSGDMEALEDVMRRCSLFWNGAGSLILPVSPKGRMPQWVGDLLEARPVDDCFIHETLGEQPQAAVRKLLPDAVPLWDRFDDREAHPLHLLGPAAGADAPKPSMLIPAPATPRLRRAALALWGNLPSEDLPYWRQHFNVGEAPDDAALTALIAGQTDYGMSPLLLSSHSMRGGEQTGWRRPHIWCFERIAFGDLVIFWNVRARILTTARGASVVGLTREMLRPRDLRTLVHWLPRLPGQRMTPDAVVIATERLRPTVRKTLNKVPFAEEVEELRLQEQMGRDVEPNDPPTYRFLRPRVTDHFIRGTFGSALVAFDRGRSSLMLPAPERLALRGGQHVRVVLRNLPMPLPVTTSAARRVMLNGEARDGVMVTTNAFREWNWDIRLPTAAEALPDWAGDHGYTVKDTQDGHYAEALLRRVGNVHALEVLADQKRLSILHALAPRSRDKLGQQMVNQARDAGIELDPDEVAERLSDIGLFLEVEARTANDIAGAMGQGTKKRDVLKLLPPLVELGFVRRARDMRCPHCRFRMLLDLADFDETVQCRACRAAFLLPVVDSSGSHEPELFYRLDGLMARAMDQDVLPVLLTLRALHPPAEHTNLFFAWPGVEFRAANGVKVDVDLMVSDGAGGVSCFEVKANAGGLRESQLRKLMALATNLGARPGIAAVWGEFAPELVEQVTEAGGRVLTVEDMFA